MNIADSFSSCGNDNSFQCFADYGGTQMPYMERFGYIGIAIIKDYGCLLYTSNQSAWLKPTEDSYYLSQVWKEKGYSKLLDLA